MCKKRRTIKIRERERERRGKKERKGEERKLEIVKKKQNSHANLSQGSVK
tara:strand:+ start:1799 stop:1948 length:150 start_codon:yes stop_codon:yes gene_type:complete